MLLAFCYRGDRGHPPKKRRLSPLNFRKDNRKNNRNNSLLFWKTMVYCLAKFFSSRTPVLYFVFHQVIDRQFRKEKKTKSWILLGINSYPSLWGCSYGWVLFVSYWSTFVWNAQKNNVITWTWQMTHCHFKKYMSQSCGQLHDFSCDCQFLSHDFRWWWLFSASSWHLHLINAKRRGIFFLSGSCLNLPEAATWLDFFHRKSRSFLPHKKHCSSCFIRDFSPFIKIRKPPFGRPIIFLSQQTWVK